MNPVFAASTTDVTPAASAPVGATDGIFYVSGDGSVKQKVGAPATFTRASTAVLGGRTYQPNEPRFMDNGLLCEPTTTNLAASVIDVTNASTKGWHKQTDGVLEIASTKTYNHSSAIHLISSDGGRNYFQKYIGGIGETATLSFMAYVVSGSCYATIEEQSSSQNYPYSSSNVITEIGVWKRVVVTRKFTAESNTCYFVYLAADSEVYIDDIQLEKRPYATSFTPTSRDAADRLTIAEWVVNKTKWTCEFDCALNDKQVNYERPMSFITSGGSVYRYETSTGYSVVKGENLKEMSVLDQTLTVPHKNAITFENGTVTYYHDGKAAGTAQETSGDKVLSAIWLGDCNHDPFNGCFKNFRFSSTVHTAEKIAADSKLDALPVEDDTVLYMPLKEDLSMYGHYND